MCHSRMMQFMKTMITFCTFSRCSDIDSLHLDQVRAWEIWANTIWLNVFVCFLISRQLRTKNLGNTVDKVTSTNKVFFSPSRIPKPKMIFLILVLQCCWAFSIFSVLICNFQHLVIFNFQRLVTLPQTTQRASPSSFNHTISYHYRDGT